MGDRARAGALVGGGVTDLSLRCGVRCGGASGVRIRGWNGERGLTGELAQRSPPPLRKPPPPLSNPGRNGDRDLGRPKPLGERERCALRWYIGDLGDTERFLGDLGRNGGLEVLLGFSVSRGGTGLRSLDLPRLAGSGDLSLLAGNGDPERSRRTGRGDLSFDLSRLIGGDLSLEGSLLAGPIGNVCGRDCGGRGGDRGLVGKLDVISFEAFGGAGGDLSFDLCLTAGGEGDLLLNRVSLGDLESALGGGGVLRRRIGERDRERRRGGGDRDRPLSRSLIPDVREMERLRRGGGVRDRGRAMGGGDRRRGT